MLQPSTLQIDDDFYELFQKLVPTFQKIYNYFEGTHQD